LNWSVPEKPAELTETRLVSGFLDGTFPVESTLPAERELALQLGVTRPTLREALQRLARDGWIEIRQGKPTRVRNYWQEGNLAVLAAIARRRQNLPANFVPDLLSVRILLAPAYARLAVERAPRCIISLLESAPSAKSSPEEFSVFDWQVHHQLTICSGNPVFTLILNGFQDLYTEMGKFYFSVPETRTSSLGFYSGLLTCAREGDAVAAQNLTSRIMGESLLFWQQIQERSNGGVD
jgi:GntR family transcriptional regulator, negative regulator for fad regulon and positive regulator of fabA